MSDTIAILTGASRGIGAAMARGLAKPGTRLITLARREDPELAAYARSQDVQLEQLSVDLSDLKAAEATAERICAALPRDARRYLLINNAGTVHPVTGTDALIDSAAITTAFNLNVTAVMLLGKGLHSLQEVGALPLVPLRFITVDLLGIYPDAVSLVPQGVLAAVPIVWVLLRRRGRAQRVPEVSAS